ncbi:MULTISPECIES: TlpA family protein disulfide reductase [Nitrincola]|uniref:Thiol-disulfide oxidoreductase resA n=1 Tax=Nitrincola nitratireducens TaxID=1229521 RepID=W9UXB0_9GAMM|nr:MULTISPECIES: TlpA disulfide reductase family protein [Nitrincola]EXJ11873.1 Thiol-disulfide oxidoreductase resA [Nitrincola nitratireducens]
MKYLKPFGILALILAVAVSVYVHFWPKEPLPEQLVLASLSGQPASFSDVKGDLLIVNFWATWCPPCVREMPLLESYAAKEGVSVVLINQGETVPAINQFLTTHQLDFQHLWLDPRQEALHHMKVRGLPTTLFYSREGYLLASHLGELSEEDLQSLVSKHL